MPVKKVKGKAKGKSKGKSKGKKTKKKGKKGSKTGDGLSKEALLKESIATAKLWEARYNAAEASRKEYRQNAQSLMFENDSLQTAINQTERDTIEVIAFLKKKDSQKDQECSELKNTIRELKQGLRKEWSGEEKALKARIADIEAEIVKKDQEISVMQAELKTMREFRRKRTELQDQLEGMTQSLQDSEHNHKQQIAVMEQRFFEEKVRLQKEANRRIEELASKAHHEAVANLDERTRSIYKENASMVEALSLHMSEEESLRKQKQELEMANRQLAAEKELSQQLAQNKIQQGQKQKKHIGELEGKVSALEQSLTVMVREFEKEKGDIEKRHESDMMSTTAEITTLKRQCQLQKRETAHIKRLARHLLDQRSELEQFFIDALAQVKKEIERNRRQYRIDAEKAFNQQMMEAFKGKRQFPPIKTFKQTLKSTNSVYHDIEVAEDWDIVGDNVDISELTWEQKEQVLRVLFAKMNRKAKGNKSPPDLLSIHTPPPSLDERANDKEMLSITSSPCLPPIDKPHTGSGVFITQQTNMATTGNTSSSQGTPGGLGGTGAGTKTGASTTTGEQQHQQTTVTTTFPLPSVVT